MNTFSLNRFALLLAAAMQLALPGSALAVDFFTEDFEGLTLGQIVTFESEIREREAWTKTGPAGWTIDDSGVPTVGNPLTGVTEFEGWSFVSKDWWQTTAGDQGRTEFLNARGIVAVADPDEWDDFGTPQPEDLDTNNDEEKNDFSARLLTPAINVGGAGVNELKAFLHSSWRPEDNQKATINAIYDGGAPVEVLRYESEENLPDETPNPFYKDDATNEALTLDLLNPDGASTVQLEFRLFDAGNDWWWAFDNLQVFTGASPASDAVLRVLIDRDTQEVTIQNNTGEAVDLRGYSITSSAGVFDEASAAFLSGGDANWLQATQLGDEANDLSEVHLTSDMLAAGEAIALGAVWGQYFEDASDVGFEYLLASSDDPVSGIIEFIGNDDESFEFLDLNFNGEIEIGDWEAFKSGFGTALDGLNGYERYTLGDLDDDGLHTAADFITFERLYDQANGAGAFAAALSVPEPSGFAIAGLAILGLVGRRRLVRATPLAAALLVALFVCHADAQLKLLDEDFESLSLLDPVEEEGAPGEDVVTRIAPAGWTIDNSGIPGLGDPETDGIVDWAGWSFANKDWWALAAGDQNRTQFTRGQGTIMVADNDEWDDDDNPVDETDDLYDTFIKTPVINIPAGVPAGRLQLIFDSSWRDEADTAGPDSPASNQTATVQAFYNGSSNGLEVLRWESDAESDFFKDDAEDERVVLDLQYDGSATSIELEFGLGEANNDWWWAIDNLLVAVPADPSILRVNTFNGQGTLVGGDVIPTPIKSIDITSENGVLTGAASGLTASAGDSLDGPDAGSTAGDSPGEQWEILTSSEERLFEAYLFGESVFDENRSANLGSILDLSADEADRDLSFTYTTDAGDLIEGVVEYFFDDTVGLPGDFNLDGAVDAADYTVWRDGLGTTYVQADYDTWKNNYGATASSNAAVAAVPEPGALALIGLGLLTALARRVRRPACVAAATLAAAGVTTTDAEAFTLDRDYTFGDSTFSENAVAGAEVGGASINGATRDSAGQPGMNQIIDLLPNGNLFIQPKYIAINDRPDGVSGLGIDLNPLGLEEQYLATGFEEALNFPERSASSTFAIGGTIDYTVISDRGFSIWAKPSALPTAGNQANIVMDTNQHGVFINDQGNYAMRYADRDYASEIPAAVGDWAHLSVVRAFGPGSGSILYVDGVAAAATTGQYRIERVVNEDTPTSNIADLDTSPLVVGGSTGAIQSLVGNSDHFSGVVDDLEMFVMGLNASNDFGEYVFERDDRYAAAFKPSNPVDLTGEGSIDFADAIEFASNWRSEKSLTWIDAGGTESSLVVGDLETRGRGDFNFDGRVDLADWGMLNNASPATAAAAMRLIAGVIPEPSTGVLVLLAISGLTVRRR
ncbi:PEP-CTERM motif protein [Planctomycetes bacterium MalM25]|nr:PEP-CTERM motif protein [Planctomycetes bacterium MalM25]